MAIFGIQIFKRFRITRKLPGKRRLSKKGYIC